MKTRILSILVAFVIVAANGQEEADFPMQANPCAAVFCAFGYRCKPVQYPRPCFTTPCPQYDCVKIGTSEDVPSGHQVA